jgi:hypothetical protein
MNGKRIAWTKDDQLITLRAIKRGQFATFNEMVEADDTAAHQMYEHEAGKHLDEMYDYYLEEQMQQWMAEEADAEERAAAEAATEHLY